MISVPVLLYHSVDDDPGGSERAFAVSRRRFAAHLDALEASRRTAMTITELGAALRGTRALPPRPVAITFDDGYADNREAIEQVHARGLRATLYVTCGQIGARNRLTPSQLGDLAEHPDVELGAHSVTHRRLDELDGAELEYEVTASRLRLEQLTGRAVRSFAYPHGAYDERVRQAVRAGGYSSAAAVKNALSHACDDPFAIARWTVTPDVSAERLAAVVEGEGVPLAWSRERLRTRAYRLARRSRRRIRRRAMT